jgi:radical SAM superfamily enzyme YgiQ (UPF0313 family)
MNKIDWTKAPVYLNLKSKIYVSVVFTWHLEAVRRFATTTKKKIIVGGPATKIMPDYFMGISNVKVGDFAPINFIEAHNPLATFTTRGCPNTCTYCAVPKLETEFMEIEDYPVKPLVCDNNFLAASPSHIEGFVEKAQSLPFVDFNQGLDARLFKKEHAKLFKNLPSPMIRFSMDTKDRENDTFRAIDLCRENGLKNISIYILINHEETPEEAFYKLEQIKETGAMTFPMRYQPLWSSEYNEYVSDKWRYVFGEHANKWLKETCRYYSMYKRLGVTSFDIWINARFKEEMRLF